jgi:hypothetical protein
VTYTGSEKVPIGSRVAAAAVPPHEATLMSRTAIHIERRTQPLCR